MATRNSLLVGARNYRGVTIRPMLGGGWVIHQIGTNAAGRYDYPAHMNSLRHARDVISNFLATGDFIALDGALVKKEI
jgi:hypothetical protein